MTATPEDPKAVVEIVLNDSTVVENGTAAAWNNGSNTLIVKVTNSDQSKTYTINVTKNE